MKRTACSASALALAIGIAGLLGTHDAHAACTGVGLFSCSATVTVPLPLAFGNYDPSSLTPKDNTTAINVVGTVTGLGILVTLSYSIGLSAGTGGSIANRQLTGPGSTPLGYNLYTTNARTAVWGAGTVTDSYGALASVGGNSVPRSYTVYGRIPIGQYVAPGSYSNTITVTVTY
ncbi:spore coat protein U-like protein [Variovorax boronicumulans]|uniref:Csu type fimbrial protein n=1 Tax=Variovorax boronicumulans TaxID=436515 RepID=UPI00278653E9|nr:spore coat U domain-containing protein [Variovorax boronicumulans]MDP9990778.1 spore coat protein U-like protein [Variovorax boronicumulans]MDQ0002806.1 spore coat protein U-like protein [Variovorax boronicumulans]